MAESKASGFWKKSIENRIVSQQASQKQHYNAAASRYYYALYQAAFAFLEVKKIPVPDKILRQKRWVKNKNPDTWPHRELSENIDGLFIGSGFQRIMKNAWDLRIKGDYKDTPVEPDEYALITGKADRLFEVIRNEIDKDETKRAD